MKTEITEIIKSIIKLGSDNNHEEKYIAKSILNLRKWPNLTESETKEIESVAYSIYLLDGDVDEKGLLVGLDFPYCLQADYDDYTNENTSHYAYTTYNRPVQKKKTFMDKFLDIMGLTDDD